MDEQTLIETIGTTDRETETTELVLLRAIHSQLHSAGELADITDISRQTVYDSLDPLVNAGVVDNRRAEYTLNGSGTILLRTYTEFDPVTQEGMTSFAANADHYRLFDTLTTQPATKRELETLLNGPSRKTIYRWLQDFETNGWIVRNTAGAYELTAAGYDLLQTYEAFTATCTQILEKQPCLRHLGVECADLPVHALDEARMETSIPSSPYRENNEYIDFLERLNEHEYEQIRHFSSYFDFGASKAYTPFVDAGVQLDFISPVAALGQLPTAPEKVNEVRKGFDASNVAWYLYAGDLPTGLAIFDREWVVITPADPFSATARGTIFTKNDQIIDWAVTLYERYLTDADPATEFLTVFRSFANAYLDTVVDELPQLGRSQD